MGYHCEVGSPALRMPADFRAIDRETGFLLPPSIDDWLPEQDLARFVVEVIDGLDLSAMVRSYRGSGSASYHPALLLGLLVYGYATGVFSSRKLERVTYDSVAFRFIAANEHPDHDTIATFRRRFLKDIEGLFVRVLELAREMGMLKLGTVALDGTKIHANASRHSALSHEHAGKIEAQLKAEVADLMARAEAADQADIPDGTSIPEELARREERLRKLAEARAKIEARAFGIAATANGHGLRWRLEVGDRRSQLRQFRRRRDTRRWRHRQPGAHMAPGGSATAPPWPSHSPTPALAAIGSPFPVPTKPINLPNRRIRTRTHGGAGGVGCEAPPIPI
jgi:transposase